MNLKRLLRPLVTTLIAVVAFCVSQPTHAKFVGVYESNTGESKNSYPARYLLDRQAASPWKVTFTDSCEVIFTIADSVGIVKSYTVVTNYDEDSKISDMPTSWRLQGQNAAGQWVTLDYQANFPLLPSKWTGTSPIHIPQAKQGIYKKYRFALYSQGQSYKEISELFLYSCEHVDNDDDYCDKCGEEVYHTHVDSDNNKRCDRCGAVIVHTHVDGNDDGHCDLCGDLCEHNHRDNNGDYKCDVVGCDYIFEHTHKYDNGFCVYCEGLQECERVTSSNYKTLGLTEQYIGYFAVGNAGQLFSYRNMVTYNVRDYDDSTSGKNASAVITKDIILNPQVLSSDKKSLAVDASTLRVFNYIKRDESASRGSIDGMNHTISGLYMVRQAYDDDYNSFCRTLYSGCEIKDLTLKDIYVEGAWGCGGLVAINKGHIENCHVEGLVYGSKNSGGVVGEMAASGSIERCSFNGVIKAKYSTTEFAGVVGCPSSGSTITNCYSTGTSISGCPSGIHGSSKVSATNCYSTMTFENATSTKNGISPSTTDVNCYHSTTGSTTGASVNVTGEQMASGEVCFLLNNSSSQGDLAWFQTINSDASPVLVSTGSNTVYTGISKYCDGTGEKVVYTNDPNSGVIVNHSHDGFNDNGIATCSKCSTLVFQPATLNSNEVFEVGNAGQLEWIAQYVNAGNDSIKVVLVNDINLAGIQHTPIGTAEHPFFDCSFNGQGHSITGMTITNYTESNQGLFGVASGTHKGALKTNITNFTVSGEMTSSASGVSNIAGVVGYANYTITMSDITSNVNISIDDNATQNNIGGIAGNSSRVTIARCVNNGNLKVGKANCAAGILAYGWGYTNVVNCLNTGNISATDSTTVVGGILGYTRDGGRVAGSQNCLNTGKVLPGGPESGAIFGKIDAIASQGSNNYYLNTSYGKGVGLDNSDKDVAAQTFAITDEQVKNGYAAYYLNGKVSAANNVWNQVIGTDNVPRPATVEGGVVYCVIDTLCSGKFVELFTNDQNATGKHYEHNYVDGECTLCGDDVPEGILVKYVAGGAEFTAKCHKIKENMAADLLVYPGREDEKHTLKPGWYVVKDTVALDNLYFKGDEETYIILADSSNLVISDKLICGTLTCIYGQRGKTGTVSFDNGYMRVINQTMIYGGNFKQIGTNDTTVYVYNEKIINFIDANVTGKVYLDSKASAAFMGGNYYNPNGHAIFTKADACAQFDGGTFKGKTAAFARPKYDASGCYVLLNDKSWINNNRKVEMEWNQVEGTSLCESALSEYTVADDVDVEVGDVNGDGSIDIVDINAVINVIMGNATNESYGGRADVNGDGDVDIVDVNAIINLILGS